MTSIQSLYQHFLEELEDAYDFEHQLLDALPKMADKANDAELRKGFREHLQQTRGQVEQLEAVFSSLGEKAKRKTCKGMKGLIKEGGEVLKARGDEAAIDAALIGAAQRVEHYEMAAYGTLRSFARALGRDREAKVLQRILEQEAKTDEKLSKLAESRVNPRAVDGAGRRAAASRRTSGDGRARSAAGRRRTTGGGDGELTRDELYERAQKLDVEGRSKMTKSQLQRAVQRGA